MGFTLLELLVVVGVLTALLAILLPALGAAREIARRSVCGANLHSIATGLNLYAGAAGVFPCAYVFNCNNYYPAPGITHWSEQIFAGVYNPENVLHCPSVPHGGLPPTDTTPDNLEPGQANNESGYVDVQAIRCAYTVNEALCPQPYFLADPPPKTPMGMCHYVGTTNVDLHTTRLYRSVAVAEVDVPANTILATEWPSDWRLVSGPAFDNAKQNVSLSYRPVHGFALAGASALDPFDVNLAPPAPGQTPALRRLGLGELTSHPIPPGWQQPRLNWLGRNHDGGTITNFAYVDGHVESKTIEQTLVPFEWGQKFYSLRPGDDIAALP